MTVVRDWAVGLCATAFATAIVRGLMPRGAASKSIAFLSSLLFFCCLIAPLRELGEWVSALSVDLTSSTAVTDDVKRVSEEQLLSAMELSMTEEAVRLLSEYDVNVRSVTLERDITRSDNIYIASATVVVDKQQYPIDGRVYDVLERAWSIPVEVWYGE